MPSMLDEWSGMNVEEPGVGILAAALVGQGRVRACATGLPGGGSCARGEPRQGSWWELARSFVTRALARVLEQWRAAPVPDVGMRKALGSVTQFLRPQMNCSSSSPVGVSVPTCRTVMKIHADSLWPQGSIHRRECPVMCW